MPSYLVTLFKHIPKNIKKIDYKEGVNILLFRNFGADVWIEVMMRRITALFFFLGVYVLGFAENTRGKEYILVLNSINFNEAWANNLYQNIRDEFSSPGFHVEAEELSIPWRVSKMLKKKGYIYCPDI